MERPCLRPGFAGSFFSIFNAILIIVLLSTSFPLQERAYAGSKKKSGADRKIVITGTPERIEKPVAFDFGPPDQDPSRNWTVMVYMDGDNDLEPYALSDLNEMEAGLEGNTACIVLMDRAKGYDESDGDWHDTRVFRVQKDSDPKRIASKVIAMPGEMNLGDGRVLEEFLKAAMKSYPAKRYALVLWDHGGGWASHANDYDAPGSMTGRDHLTLPELSSAVRSSLASTGVDRLDLIGFDMCLMAQIETATELQGLADVMIASQAIEPGDGWPYTKILPAFGAGTKGPRNLASHIVEQYADFYRDRKEAVYTLSALDLDKTGKVLTAFDRVLAKLGAGLDAYWPTISRALFFSEAYAARTEVQRGKMALASIDLIDALKRIQVNLESFPAQREFDEFVEAMDSLIIANQNSPARRLSNGLAIYAPVTKSRFNDVYAETKFFEKSAWSDLLQKLYILQEKDSSKPAIRDIQLVDYSGNQIVPIQSANPLSTHGVLHTVEGRNLLWLKGMYGERLENDQGMVVHVQSTVTDTNWTKRSGKMAAELTDLVIPEYQDGVNQHIVVFSGYRYAVTNGEKTCYATLEIPLGAQQISMPILYRDAQAGEFGGTAYFDARWWDTIAVVLEMPQEDGSVVYRQVKPSPDAEVTPLFRAILNSGEVRYLKSETLKWRDGLELLLSLYEPGNYVITLTAEAINGRSETALFSFPVELQPDLKVILEKGSKYNPEDLIGTWTYIDPKAHRDEGRIVPLGARMRFSRHPQQKGLLVSEVTSQKTPDAVMRSVVFPDTRMLPHLRMFEVPGEGQAGSPLKSDYSVYLTTLFRSPQGMPVMLLQNIMNLNIYMAVKEETRTSAPASPAQPPPSPQPQGLEGVWQSVENDVIIIKGQQYQAYAEGQLVDAGVFQVSGNVMATQSAYTGVVTQFLFQRTGNVLMLQDGFGEVYQYELKN